MTHGHILICDTERKDRYPLYAAHDGHTEQIVRDLIHLPVALFDKSVSYALASQADDFKPQLFHDGPWFMQVLLLAIFHPGDRPARVPTRESVSGSFRSLGFGEVHPRKLATWVQAMWFDRWVIAPADYKPHRQYVPDVIVEVNHAESNYVIKRGTTDDEYYSEAIDGALTTLGTRLDGVLPGMYPVAKDYSVTVPFHDVVYELTCDYLINRRWEKPDAI